MSEQTARPNLTPTQAHHVVNRKLAAEGIDRKITPQMMYGYAKKGALRKAVVSENPWILSGDLFNLWLVDYIARAKQGGAVALDYDLLAAAYG